MRGKRNPRQGFPRSAARTSWDPVAEWYTGWVGERGSEHHRKLAIPAVMDLLVPREGERVLDVGSGHGVLAPIITATGAKYTGVDASSKLINFAQKHHGDKGKFLLGDARKLSELPDLRRGSFDAAVFLLSIQDMDPLDEVLNATAWALRDGGHIVILMTHPCFRVPRQSGWGWDEQRKLQYRRIDRYLTSLAVPMKPYTGIQKGVTYSFHRSLQDYFQGLIATGFCIDGFTEIPTYKVVTSGPNAKAQNLAHQEIPLFLGLRAVKIG